MASPTGEELVQRLQEMRTDLAGQGKDFSLGFLALQDQAEEDTIAAEALEEVQDHASSVTGQPFSGVRNRAYYFTGEEEPEVRGGDVFSNLPFKGILHGVELVRIPDTTDEDELLCLVIDPVASADNPAIQKSTHFQQDSWVTHLPGRGIAESRLWIPAGGIRNLRINTDYIGTAIRETLEADRKLSEVLQLLPEETLATAK